MKVVRDVPLYWVFFVGVVLLMAAFLVYLRFFIPVTLNGGQNSRRVHVSMVTKPQEALVAQPEQPETPDPFPPAKAVDGATAPEENAGEESTDVHALEAKLAQREDASESLLASQGETPPDGDSANRGAEEKTLVAAKDNVTKEPHEKESTGKINDQETAGKNTPLLDAAVETLADILLEASQDAASTDSLQEKGGRGELTLAQRENAGQQSGDQDGSSSDFSKTPDSGRHTPETATAAELRMPVIKPAEAAPEKATGITSGTTTGPQMARGKQQRGVVLKVEGADTFLEEDHALCGLGTVYGESPSGPFHIYRKGNSSEFNTQEFLKFFSGKCMPAIETEQVRSIRRRHDLPPDAQIYLCLSKRAEVRVMRLLRSNGYRPDSDVDITVEATGDGDIFNLKGIRVRQTAEKERLAKSRRAVVGSKGITADGS